MLSKKQINEHLAVLRLNFDPDSPFKGMVDLEGEDGLLSLPVEDQQLVFDAMQSSLHRMVMG